MNDTTYALLRPCYVSLTEDFMELGTSIAIISAPFASDIMI